MPVSADNADHGMDYGANRPIPVPVREPLFPGPAMITSKAFPPIGIPLVEIKTSSSVRGRETGGMTGVVRGPGNSSLRTVGSLPSTQGTQRSGKLAGLRPCVRHVRTPPLHYAQPLHATPCYGLLTKRVQSSEVCQDSSRRRCTGNAN